jgi:two-component system response regulator AtoC
LKEPTEAFIRGLFNAPLSFSSLLDEIPHGILILDPERRAVVMNRALQGLTGFFHTPVRRLPCAHILRSDVCILRCPALNMTPHSSEVCREGNLINRNRQKIPVRITLSPLKTEDGRTAGFMETVEDLSLLREMGDQHAQESRIEGLIGQSPEMKRILNMVPAVAQTDSSVLITGETGTGKDLVAEALHRASSRAKGPFIKVNCGALPETLLESELFGHKKGAFTGAVDNKPGRFKLAHNGTLFLTEIGDLPLNLQVKLLTFLDDRMIHPLGSSTGFQADVRVIAATHRDLEAMVREDRFRRDLLYRLNVVRLELPPSESAGKTFASSWITFWRSSPKGSTNVFGPTRRTP